MDGSVHLDLCGKAAEYRILLGHVASSRLFANVIIVWQRERGDVECKVCTGMLVRCPTDFISIRSTIHRPKDRNSLHGQESVAMH